MVRVRKSKKLKDKDTMNNIIDIEGANVFRGKKQILHDINWRVAEGEHWFILGPNGAGKSTLINLLMGFAWPIFGAKVEVLGNRYGKCNLMELRKKFSWISPLMFSMTQPETTAIDVVLSGLDATIGIHREVTPEEVAIATETLEKLECGYLTNQTFGTLSSGEQVKILICRGMLLSPQLLILDEACVHLDLHTREYLLNYIDNIAAKKIVSNIIFISHRIEDITPTFTKGMIITDGRIAHHGERGDILTEENIRNTFNLDITLHATSNGRFWPQLGK